MLTHEDLRTLVTVGFVLRMQCAVRIIKLYKRWLCFSLNCDEKMTDVVELNSQFSLNYACTSYGLYPCWFTPDFKNEKSNSPLKPNKVLNAWCSHNLGKLNIVNCQSELGNLVAV